MTTGYMKIICSECRKSFPMYPDRKWYNWVDESMRDPIGFCSIECIEIQKARWSARFGLLESLENHLK